MRRESNTFLNINKEQIYYTRKEDTKATLKDRSHEKLKEIELNKNSKLLLQDKEQAYNSKPQKRSAYFGGGWKNAEQEEEEKTEGRKVWR